MARPPKTTRRGSIGRGLLLVTVLLLFLPGSLRAEAQQALLGEVMPEADTFSEKEGQPPVFKAYNIDARSREQKLMGYVFLTSDLLLPQKSYAPYALVSHGTYQDLAMNPY